MSTWLYRIATNTALMRSRRRSRATIPLDQAHLVTVEAAAATVSDPTGYHDDLMSLRQALAALPVDQRYVVVLRDIEGLPAHEVALLLDITVAATKSRLRRGRMQLRRRLR